jgi:3-oxoacyl-[acyl-carrier-protein] synthase-3
MNMDGVETLSFVREEVSDMVRSFMDGNELRYADIDVVLLHQASKIAMNTLIETAGIPADKCFSSISRIGNTSSSSIPIAYKCAEREGIIKPGQKILMVGFGAGFSAGIAVIDT